MFWARTMNDSATFVHSASIHTANIKYIVHIELDLLGTEEGSQDE